MGYLDEYETPLTPMEERGYYDEEGNLDIDAVEADGYEFGVDLAFACYLFVKESLNMCWKFRNM